ncbi:MAG: hypothetical protein ABRQ26_13280 [Syntrophomonadaceae bacterium]
MFINKTKSIIGLLLALIMVLGLASTAMAATGASRSYAVDKPGTYNTWTFKVTTKADWSKMGSESISFEQTKGARKVPTGPPWAIKYKTVKDYTKLTITAKPTDGSKTKTARLTGSSVKLNLDANKTYQVTVAWMDDNEAMLDEISKGVWTTDPTWKISSTNKCTYTTPQ